MPQSVTFVSERTGWVLGTAACASGRCPALLRTTDGGATWSRLPVAPPAPPGASPPSARRVRFADTNDGWIFGPDLWVTHDGGAHWSQPSLPGLATGSTVAALEASAGLVHAAVAEMGDAPSVRILTSAVGQDDWRLSPTSVPIGAGPVPGTQIVLHGQAGWLLQVNRTVVGGARLVRGAWESWPAPCADVMGPATLAASTAQDVVAACDEGQWSTPAGEHLHVSANGGTTFRRISTDAPRTVLITSPQSTIVVAAGVSDVAVPSLSATFDMGAHWQAVFTGTAGATFNDLGFTTPQRGIVVESSNEGSSGRLLQSVDGGRSWRAVTLTSKA